MSSQSFHFSYWYSATLSTWQDIEHKYSFIKTQQQQQQYPSSQWLKLTFGGKEKKKEEGTGANKETTNRYKQTISGVV